MTKQRWLGLGVGVTAFLIAFGLALAQQLFQVSRTVPADLEVFDTTVLPDGQLVLEFRNGTPVEHISFSPNPPKDTDGRREDSGRGWVRELQGRWPGVLG